MATWLEKLRKIKENDTRIKRLQQTMTHGANTPMPDMKDMNAVRRAIALRNVPHDVAYGEAGLEGGVPTDPYLGLSPLDLIPTGMGAKLATLAGGIAGTFIGKGAKTWNAVMKDTAKKLESQGVSPEEIWKQTGTFRGADKKWRQEIPDNLAKYDPDALKELKELGAFNYKSDTQPLAGVIEHKPLFSAYPDIGDVPVHFMPPQNMKGASGAYSPRLDRLTMRDVDTDQLNPLLHETQHAIQQREGWARGGNPDAAYSQGVKDEVVNSLFNKYRSMPANSTNTDEEIMAHAVKMASKPEARTDAYKRLAGEVEARLTQARMNMTPEQRAASYPPSMYDVPMENQIVRMSDLTGDSLALSMPKTLYRGLDVANDTSRINPIDWYSETPELANKYGSNIITKEMPENINAADLGFRDYMTEVKKDDVLDRIKRNVMDSFSQGKIDSKTATDQVSKLNNMRGGDDFKRVHEWIMNDPSISNILQDSGYNAISHIEQGNQTYGFLNSLAAKQPKTQYELAHDLAQRNAALPIEQGGLGLPASNTAMERAKAMGFDTPTYHGTNADFPAYSLEHTGTASGAEQYGLGVYTASNPSIASGYANPNKEGANVLPLMVRMQSPLSPELEKQMTLPQIKSILKQSPELDDALWNFGDVGYEGKAKVFNEAAKQVYEYQGDKMLNNLHPIANDFFRNSPQAFNDAVTKVLKKDGVQVDFANGDKFHIPFNPNQVRSRFAAFDPFQRNSANILAGGAAGAVGLSSLAGLPQDDYY